MFECFLHRLSKINWEYRWSSTCFPSLKILLAQMSDYFACCHLCLFVPESDIKKFWDFYLFRRANSISDTFFFHRAGLSRLFSGECVAAGPDFWVALSPANVWALPIRQIYSTWTDTPSGSPPLSRLASFESGRGGELLLSANLHTRGELAIQIYSRLILLPKSEAHCSNLRWGDCVKTARRVLGGPSEVRFFGLSVYPEEILLAPSGTISVS